MLLADWIKRKPACQRLGQAFVNQFIRHPWPELFYEEDEQKALNMIKQWLQNHCYFDTMPPQVT